MKHGEGITLTLTGRCPILCRATINNMAASGTFALEKEVHSESHVLTATTFFLVLLLFLVWICCLFCVFSVSSWPTCLLFFKFGVLPVEDSCVLSKSCAAEINFVRLKDCSMWSSVQHVVLKLVAVLI